MMFWRIFRLELRVAFRHSAEIANPLWFFLIVITLFPLSIGPVSYTHLRSPRDPKTSRMPSSA